MFYKQIIFFVGLKTLGIFDKCYSRFEYKFKITKKSNVLFACSKILVESMTHFRERKFPTLSIYDVDFANLNR